MAAGNPTHYNVSYLKSRFLHLAQTSVYHVKFRTTPELQSFLSSDGRDVYPLDVENLSLLCSEASLPGSTLATHEVTGDYAGVTEKMVYRRIYDDSLDLTFYVDSDYKVIEFFDGWMNYSTGQGAVRATGRDNESYRDNTQSYRMIYPKLYRGGIYITKFEKDPKRSYRTMDYEFIDAFPISIVSSPISYNTSEILKFTVSFSYTRYVRSTKQMVMGTSTSNPNAPGVPELKGQYYGPAFANLDNNQILINNGVIPGEGAEIAAAYNVRSTRQDAAEIRDMQAASRGRQGYYGPAF